MSTYQKLGKVTVSDQTRRHCESGYSDEIREWDVIYLSLPEIGLQPEVMDYTELPARIENLGLKVCRFEVGMQIARELVSGKMTKIWEEDTHWVHIPVEPTVAERFNINSGDKGPIVAVAVYRSHGDSRLDIRWQGENGYWRAVREETRFVFLEQ